MEALSWYVESLTAFWVSFASGGIFRLILLLWLISMICGRRRRWARWGYHRHCCRCSHCGCRCGHCPCGADEDEDEDGKGKKK